MNRIVIFGTFDIVHTGHENFFQQAKILGSFLLVSVARDKFVKEAKGKHPKNNEKKRVQNVRKSKTPDRVVLGSKTHNFYRTIRSYKIDTIALGYDQKPSIMELNKSLKKHHLSKIKVVRLKSYKPNLYKSSLLL